MMDFLPLILILIVWLFVIGMIININNKTNRNHKMISAIFNKMKQDTDKEKGK